MKKIVLVAALILVFLTAGLYAQKAVLKVKVSLANVRAEADATSSVITQVKMGTLLEADAKVGSFYQVTVTDKTGAAVTGFIHNSVVDVISGGVEAPEEVYEEAPSYGETYAPAGAMMLGGRVRIFAGYCMANVTLDSDTKDALNDADIAQKSLNGVGFGIGYEMGTGNIRFNLDLNYAPGGSIFEGEVLGETLTITEKGAGLGISLLGKFRFMPGPSPYILAGGNLGYVLSHKAKLEYAGDSDEEDVLKDTNRTYYGVALGGGFDYPMGTFAVFAEARYNLGLSNQIKDPEEGVSAKPYSIMIILGVRL